MSERYIQFQENDQAFYGVDEGVYEQSLEDVIIRELRSRGGVTALLEPMTKPGWEGYRKLVIIVGPEDTGEEQS